MKIAIVKEILSGETRVAATPDSVRSFVRMGLEPMVQAGAGEASMISDDAYSSAGASIVGDAAAVFAEADIILKVQMPAESSVLGKSEADVMKRGAVLVSPLYPSNSPELVGKLVHGGVTSFALEKIPRIARAQSMDILSSMSTIAGYKAVLLAADAITKMMPLMMTAAGTLQPANVLVIGAGVAGLQAIATAKRLGANVKAIDTRPAVKEQVESLGAKFIPLEVTHAEAETAGGYAAELGEEFYKQEQEIIAPHAKSADVIISTALIPNRRAPLLINEQMVEFMRSGSVIVDLAAEAGGNCSLTKAGKTIEHGGVKIMGPVNLPASMPACASIMFSRNVATFLGEIIKEGHVNIDLENEIIRETLITRDGQLVHQAVLQEMAARKEKSK